MSHGKRDGDTTAGSAVAAFLRALAQRADADPAFAAQVRAALDESGLASGLASGQADERPRQGNKRASRPAAAAASAPATESPPDPFTIYRTQGEERLRVTLDGLELATLRAIVRAHRLDPARISARWAARERVIALIVDQVKARVNHGRAFERI